MVILANRKQNRKVYNIYKKQIMSIINSILKVFVGDKAANDIKAIQPIVHRIEITAV